MPKSENQKTERLEYTEKDGPDTVKQGRAGYSIR